MWDSEYLIWYQKLYPFLVKTMLIFKDKFYSQNVLINPNIGIAHVEQVGKN